MLKTYKAVLYLPDNNNKKCQMKITLSVFSSLSQCFLLLSVSPRGALPVLTSDLGLVLTSDAQHCQSFWGCRVWMGLGGDEGGGEERPERVKRGSGGACETSIRICSSPEGGWRSSCRSYAFGEHLLVVPFSQLSWYQLAGPAVWSQSYCWWGAEC